MSLRLSHVIVLMALILAAGVLSARHLAADAGATVPGIVVVRAEQLDATGLAALDSRLSFAHAPGAPAAPDRSSEGRGSPDLANLVFTGLRPTTEDVACSAAPLAPFDVDFGARRAAEGAATVLVSVPLRDDAAARRGWHVIVADPARPADLAASQRAASIAAEFVLAQTGLRSFVLALDPGDDLAPADLAALLGPVLQAAGALPRTRRTSVVILGARDEASGRRRVLRVDLGPWGERARPGLADLLDGFP